MDQMNTGKVIKKRLDLASLALILVGVGTAAAVTLISGLHVVVLISCLAPISLGATHLIKQEAYPASDEAEKQ